MPINVGIQLLNPVQPTIPRPAHRLLYSVAGDSRACLPDQYCPDHTIACTLPHPISKLGVPNDDHRNGDKCNLRKHFQCPYNATVLSSPFYHADEQESGQYHFLLSRCAPKRWRRCCCSWQPVKDIYKHEPKNTTLPAYHI